MHDIFLSQNIFRDSKEIVCDFSVGMELQNEKTESVTENGKESKNVDEFQEYILQQKRARDKSKNTKNEEHEGFTDLGISAFL